MKFHNPSFTIQKFQVDRKVEKKKINEIFKMLGTSPNLGTKQQTFNLCLKRLVPSHLLKIKK